MEKSRAPSRCDRRRRPGRGLKGGKFRGTGVCRTLRKHSTWQIRTSFFQRSGSNFTVGLTQEQGLSNDVYEYPMPAISPPFNLDAVTLGDCLDLIGKIPNESVDVVGYFATLLGPAGFKR